MGGGKPFVTVQGKVYVLDLDELVTEDDPKGDTKIDKNGNLLDGRRFKAQTFQLPNRHPERMYMLAIDAARTSGFRDSLYYFRRNPLARKLNATQPEKDYLIEQGKLGSHLRTRSVTIITARSAFKLHGAKMLLEGRWVVDDYYEDKVLAEITAKGLKPGDLVGDLAEPQTVTIAANADTTTNQKADRGGLGMYRAGGPTTLFGGSGWGPYSDGPLNAVRKSLLNRDGLNEENWMLIAAQRTAEASADWAKQRRKMLKPCGGIFGEGGLAAIEALSAQTQNQGGKREGEAGPDGAKKKRKKVRTAEDDMPLGIYEPHAGIVVYRADTQPTRSRWEVLPETEEKRQVLGGTKTGNGAWALAWVDTVMEAPTDTGEEPGPPVAMDVDATSETPI
ncbi:chromatin remodelling complex Rsc7/Swp82 subunit-domain-containing protein [Amylostereum chailletii]|nr:chromatin remodelling complex Rsc7/Swp82 subunit-domain-containing protein [Amylostereum chailletii]